MTGAMKELRRMNELYAALDGYDIEGAREEAEKRNAEEADGCDSEALFVTYKEMAENAARLREQYRKDMDEHWRKERAVQDAAKRATTENCGAVLCACCREKCAAYYAAKGEVE